MICVRAKEGLEDLYESAKSKLEGVAAETEREIEERTRSIREEIERKYADRKSSLELTVTALSEEYEVPDEPVAESTAESTDYNPISELFSL